MTKIIRKTNVREVRNMKSKTWTQISGPGFRVLVLGLRSWIPDRSWVLDLTFQVLGLGS